MYNYLGTNHIVPPLLNGGIGSSGVEYSIRVVSYEDNNQIGLIFTL